MANKPADAEHPFGHGRIEYITAMVVSFMVMLVGLQFVKTSFQKIITPTPVSFETIPFLLLLISIGFKLWLSKFNKSIGNKINSSTLKATATDAMGDVFTSSTVVISFLIAKFTTLPIDGYIGIIVALAIVYSGYSLIKETLSPLLGEPPDPALVNDIINMVMSYDNITGIHDLVVHNYGPGRIMASIHAEIPSNIDIMKIHDIIDTAEREISKKLNIYLVIHMDPICVDTDEIIEARNMVTSILNKYDYIVGDWGFEQLRLKGFFRDDMKDVQRSQTIGAVQDYLYEYCNFGCAYFIIKNERVIKPKRTSRSRKDDRRGKKNTNSRQSRARSNRNSSRSKQRRKSHSFTTKQKAAPFTEKRRQPAKVTAGNGKQAQTTKQSSGKRHFTIRQK